MTTAQTQTVLRWSLPALTLAWAGFLFWVSTSTRGSVPPPPGLSGGSDFPYLPIGPALHLGAYGVLASLLALSTWAARPRIALLPVSLAASFVAATAYGAALELYQTTLATRAGSWGDATLNAAGAALGLVVLAGLHRWRGSSALP